MDNKKKNIVLVDDHIVIRNAMKELIEKLGPYYIINEFDNGRSLLEQIGQLENIHLIVLDISMPVLNGMETLEKLKQLENKIPVLIFTDNDDDAQAVRVFRLGARGYLRKTCTAPELSEALQEIFTTGYFHNQYFTRSIQSDHSEYSDKKTEKERHLERLTERERLFLKLVAAPEEYAYVHFADKMGIKPRLVEKCREDLFSKLGVKSKVGLAIYVYRNDLYNEL